MKIHGSDGPSPLIPVERTSRTATPNGAFGAILKESLGEPPAASVASGAATAIRFRPAIQPLEGGDGSPDRRVEGFIDLLDDYRSRLADNGVSLRELEPTVRSLEQGRAALASMAGELPEGDGLKDILNRALVTAESEIARYRRGDYLPV